MLNFNQVGDFYKKLAQYKKENGLNYSKLGGYIGKTGDAMRMAVTRKSLTSLEEKTLEKMFASEGKEQEKTPQDVRFEDVITKRVFEEIAPLLNGNTEKLLKALANLHIEINKIKIAQMKTQESVKVIEERV